VFGVLLSLEPAVAAVAGLVVLGQRLTPPQLVGLACVMAASALVLGTRERSPVPSDVSPG
jgi:inner membrane transporter RhtA